MAWLEQYAQKSQVASGSVEINITYRVGCEWSKFHLFHASLTNKYVNIKLRIRLFDSVVTPSVLYGLTTSPLTQEDFKRFGVAQQRRLHKIVGWAKLDDEGWDSVYRRLRERLRRQMGQYPVHDWADAGATLQTQLETGRKTSLTVRAARWDPRTVAY